MQPILMDILLLESNYVCTAVELIIGSKVQCVFCFEICPTEGSWGEKEGSANFKIKHTEPLTQGLTPPLYYPTFVDHHLSGLYCGTRK